MGALKGRSFVTSPDLIWRDVNGEFVAIHEVTGEYHVFNDVGRSIWLCIAEGKSPPETVDRLLAGSGPGREQVEADMEEFVQKLLSLHLIRFVDENEEE